MILKLVGTAAVVASVLSACGPTASAPSAVPTTAPAAPPTAVAPTSPPVVVATVDPPDTGAKGAITLVVDSSASHASYHAHEQLVGRTLPSEAVGTSNAVTGTVVIDGDGSILPTQSKITVDLSKLASDESRRDNFIKGNTLQTSRYPTATFVPWKVDGLPAPLPSSGQVTFQLSGDLTVHGVTKPVSWQVAVQFDGTTVTGTATASVNITDFGMTPPKAGPVLGIEDGLTLELDFSAARQA